MQVAIDGPVAAGKGTIAKILADKLGFLYVDTGAMYRVAAILSMRNNIRPSLETQDQIAQIAHEASIEYHITPQSVTILLNGEDVSEQLRTPETNRLVPLVAALPNVRLVMVEKQQAIAATHQDVIMEGRDITFRVLPNADLKVFMTADPETRAQRRLKQQQAAGHVQSYEEVLEDLEARDKLDLSRSVDPLQIVPDAMVVDTTEMSIDEVADFLIAEIIRRRSPEQTATANHPLTNRLKQAFVAPAE